MFLHKWRTLPTKYFGEVQVPFAHIQLKDSADKYHSLALQIDSGAVVSLLSRSVADLLQLELESGKRVELGSVGGATSIAYIHTIDTKFDESLWGSVRFAIAEKETVPNLLGRLDVFDNLQFDFDPSQSQTVILPQWLDKDQQRIFEFLIETEKYILKRWTELELPDPAPKALSRLMNHMGKLYVSMLGSLKLHRPYSCPLYIRVMFEIVIQLEYILKEPATRSTLYLEYEHITRYKWSEYIAKHSDGPIAKRLASSPMRPEGEKRNKEIYDRVRPMFMHKEGKRKGRLASNWYMMRIDELANELGYGGEYRLVYKACSAWAHGDPSRTHGGDIFQNPKFVFEICTSFYVRMLNRIAQAGKVILTNEQVEFLDIYSRQWH